MKNHIIKILCFRNSQEYKLYKYDLITIIEIFYLNKPGEFQMGIHSFEFFIRTKMFNKPCIFLCRTKTFIMSIRKNYDICQNYDSQRYSFHLTL